MKDANGSKVLTDVANCITRRTQRLLSVSAAKRWVANEVKRGFGDVLEGRPVNSRYWITRYRAAVNTILSECQNHKMNS